MGWSVTEPKLIAMWLSVDATKVEAALLHLWDPLTLIVTGFDASITEMNSIAQYSYIYNARLALFIHGIV